jgi:hypothetical protein
MNLSKNIAILLVGIVIGLYLYDWFLAPEVKTETIIKETIKSDTVWMVQKDTVTLYRDRIKHEYLRDTILLPDWKPSIKEFNAVFPVLYGNIHLNGEVLGEVLKTSITTDFTIPTVTNTITREKTTTIIKKPTGIYAVGGVGSDFSYSVGATFLRDKSMIGYRYQPQFQIHSLEVGFKVFGK